MKRIILLIVIMMLSGCISLGTDDDLTRIAQEEWQRAGAPAEYADIQWNGVLCLGSPAIAGNTETGVNVYIPWPWNHWEFMTRVMMRYEMSKAAWQMRAPNDVLGWCMWLDAMFHMPPSELHSWYRVFFPGEVERASD